tara:strand:+ start:365 stop:1045 length:681 start_codon:yes stop_codon:yes gene_type:complete
MFKKILDARIADLWNLYEATGELAHPGEKGLLRELFLRRVLESVLPPQFGVGSGVVVDKWERQSSQIDLLVYDKRRVPPFLEENGHGIYPMDSVLRVIEVKSDLTKRGLEQAKISFWLLNPENEDGLKMAAAGNLSEGRSYYPLCGIFAYSSGLADIPSKIAEIGGLGATNPMVCVLKKGVFFKNGESHICFQGVVDAARFFINVFLTELEATASSRKPYSLIEWL